MLAYGREPDYSRVAPGQPTIDALILSAFTGPLAVRKRRVRPRFNLLPQPVDDSPTLGEGRDKDAGSGAQPLAQPVADDDSDAPESKL
jgi:peroxisomal coenzyme A diphosphatase NUDT7